MLLESVGFCSILIESTIAVYISPLCRRLIQHRFRHYVPWVVISIIKNCISQFPIGLHHVYCFLAVNSDGLAVAELHMFHWGIGDFTQFCVRLYMGSLDIG